MYAFIEGQVCEKGNGYIVILAAGVGWQISCWLSGRRESGS